jgi:hypothetical protein
MAPLRRRMIDDMTLGNFTLPAIEYYVGRIARFARYFNSSSGASRGQTLFLVCDLTVWVAAT